MLFRSGNCSGHADPLPSVRAVACTQRLGLASKAIVTDGSRLFADFPLVGMQSFDLRRSTFDVRLAACGVRRQGNQGRRATGSLHAWARGPGLRQAQSVLRTLCVRAQSSDAGQLADISSFTCGIRSPNALGRPKRCRLHWLERPACRAGGVAPCRAGVSRAGKEGRAGGCPARNDTERGTPARRGAVAQQP